MYNLTEHSECNDVIIYDTNTLTMFETEKDFNNFFPEKGKKKFTNSLEFEPNYNCYFNMDDKNKNAKEFIYFTNMENRNIMSAYIITGKYFGEYHIFYGLPGLGKSITALHILKYEIDHEKIKTLYINCKYLNLLNKYNNYDKRS